MSARKLPLWLGLLLLPAWCAPPKARAGETFGVEAKLWNPEVGAAVRSSSDLLEGTKIDMDKDLNLATADHVPYLKIWVGGKHRLAASATRLDLNGDTTLDETIEFGGKTYTVGEEVEAKLQASIYRLAWEADWFSGGWGRLGTILGADYFDVSASIKSKTTGLEDDEDVKGPVPIVGLQGELKLLFGFSVYGEAAGIYVKRDRFEGSLVEAEAGLRYTLRDTVFISAGWRQIVLDVQDSDNEAKVSLGGATVGLGFRF